MASYTLDFKLWASITVEAASESEAIAMVKEPLDCADINAGCFADGSPILFEASIEGDPDVCEEES